MGNSVAPDRGAAVAGICVDFAVVGFGVGALLVVVGFAIRDLGPVLGGANRRSGGGDPAAVIRWSGLCHRVSAVVMAAGGLIVAATLVATLIGVSDSAGAWTVGATSLVALIAAGGWLAMNRGMFAGLPAGRLPADTSTAGRPLAAWTARADPTAVEDRADVMGASDGPMPPFRSDAMSDDAPKDATSHGNERDGRVDPLTLAWPKFGAVAAVQSDDAVSADVGKPVALPEDVEPVPDGRAGSAVDDDPRTLDAALGQADESDDAGATPSDVGEGAPPEVGGEQGRDGAKTSAYASAIFADIGGAPADGAPFRSRLLADIAPDGGEAAPDSVFVSTLLADIEAAPGDAGDKAVRVRRRGD